MADQGRPAVQVIALVKRLDHVCGRYRVAALRPAFESLGGSLQIRSWPRGLLSRLLLRLALGRPDLLLLQRELPAPWQVPLLRRAAPRLVFDFDDAVFLTASHKGRGTFNLRRAGAFAAVVQAADAVVAGNEFLRDHAALWTTPSKIHLIPTCLDVRQYEPAAHRSRGAEARLVWIGSASTLRGLGLMRPLLEHLGERLPGLTLTLICDRFLSLRHLRVRPCPWSSATEAAELAQADIGISWLPDDLWSRGKCGLKILQYMAAGLPIVANPVGLQAGLVRHGETGFLVETAGQLVEAVRTLAEDPDLRRRMGRLGRQRALAEFDVSVGRARWAALLRQLQGGHLRPSRPAARTG
jgi:glycosyltransferase involved in cell wall biosynthesis